MIACTRAVLVGATAAPTSHAAQTSTAQVRAITRVAMATSATAVFLTARQVSIAVAALERVLDRARAAPTSQTTRHTRGRDPSIRTTAAGNATRITTIAVGNAMPAPT